MAKLTTAQPIPIGTATGRSDHRTNMAQLQQTTTLRTCRADLDPPRADGLLRRTVGPAFRARTTHRRRVGNHDLKTHPVTSGRGAETISPCTLDSVGSVRRLTMSLAQRLSIAALLVAVGGIGVSPAAQAHSDPYHHHHSHKRQKGYKKGLRKANKHTYRPYHRTYVPVYAPVRRRVVVAPAPWIVPAHPFHHGTRVNVGLGFNL